MLQEKHGVSMAEGKVADTEKVVVENANSPMTEEYRDIVIRILHDNWLAEAANASLTYHNQCCPLELAPTMNDRAALANYWAEECGHSVIFGNLLRDLGCEPAPEDYEECRPAELLRLPVTSWIEHGFFQLFADSAGGVHLADYAECSYLPLRTAAAKIAKDEAGHIALGIRNIQKALSLPGGREKALEVLPIWYRASMQLFGRTDRPSARAEAAIRHGVRKQNNAELLRQYKTNIDRRLTHVGLPVPE
jgi:1,2-phenylacetyl-CoA epoxidase catalytic subunit